MIHSLRDGWITIGAPNAAPRLRSRSGPTRSQVARKLPSHFDHPAKTVRHRSRRNAEGASHDADADGNGKNDRREICCSSDTPCPVRLCRGTVWKIFDAPYVFDWETGLKRFAPHRNDTDGLCRVLRIHPGSCVSPLQELAHAKACDTGASAGTSKAVSARRRASHISASSRTRGKRTVSQSP